MTDYYQRLGISVDAEPEEIKKAYRQLALKFHPDRNPGNKQAEEQFKAINEAYGILSDPQLKREYDQKRFGQRNRANPANPQPQQRPSSASASPVDARVVLKLVEELYGKIAGIPSNRLKHEAVYEALNKMLSPGAISFLLLLDDKEANREIIEKALQCCENLEYDYVRSFSEQLTRLANGDRKSIEIIENFLSQLRLWNYIHMAKKPAIVAAVILFFIFLANMNGGTESDTYENQPQSGDLTESFTDQKQETNDNVITIKRPDLKFDPIEISPIETPKQSSEEQVKKVREQLMADGWEESFLRNGQMPDCYNFQPEWSDIDNYLEIEVGSGTDVALKLMNQETDICVRYVFVRSGSTYRITNIPEGKYYVKIAYGKDWFSKVENGQCAGKFIRNPLYEKGANSMDFNIIHYTDSYSIPSFQLQLDVISTNSFNSFKSNNISESDFNH